MKALLPALAALLLGACGRPDPDAAAVVAAAEAFLAEQRVGAWSSAFERLHVNLQRECRDAEGLRAAVVAQLGPVQHWTLGRPSVLRYTATLAAGAKRRDGIAVPIEIAFDRRGDSWAITGWMSERTSLCR